ncbi:Uncharacterised protein [Streptococcus constellatus]|nr:Uncharacterised protein [Streptococcus constellatus]
MRNFNSSYLGKNFVLKKQETDHSWIYQGKLQITEFHMVDFAIQLDKEDNQIHLPLFKIQWLQLIWVTDQKFRFQMFNQWDLSLPLLELRILNYQKQALKNFHSCL